MRIRCRVRFTGSFIVGSNNFGSFVVGSNSVGSFRVGSCGVGIFVVKNFGNGKFWFGSTHVVRFVEGRFLGRDSVVHFQYVTYGTMVR